MVCLLGSGACTCLMGTAKPVSLKQAKPAFVQVHHCRFSQGCLVLIVCRLETIPTQLNVKGANWTLQKALYKSLLGVFLISFPLTRRLCPMSSYAFGVFAAKTLKTTNDIRRFCAPTECTSTDGEPSPSLEHFLGKPTTTAPGRRCLETRENRPRCPPFSTSLKQHLLSVNRKACSWLEQ